MDGILATLREKYSIDENRIYAPGFSNGGLLAICCCRSGRTHSRHLHLAGAVLLPQVSLTIARPVLHYGGISDRLTKFEKQQATIDLLRKFNGCAGQGTPCGTDCTIYGSTKAAPVETFIHPLGHLYPPRVTPLIVKFFQEHPRGG